MRMNHVEGLDVAFSDSAPSGIEVALVLCERILQKLYTKYHRQIVWISRIYSWYLQKVAFVNLIRNEIEDDEKKDIGNRSARQHGRGFANKGVRVSSSTRDGQADSHGTINAKESEIDFSLAFQATRRHGICEPTASAGKANAIQSIDQNEEVQKGSKADGATVGCNDELSFSFHPQRNARMSSFPDETPRDSGFRLLLSLLLVCVLCSKELCLDACRSLLELFPASLPLPGSYTDAANSVTMQLRGEYNTNIVALGLTEHFSKLRIDEEAALLALGNVTQSFAVWMTIAWSCASYEHQVQLAAQASQWLLCLSKVINSMNDREEDLALSFAAWVKTAAHEYPLSRYPSVRGIIVENQFVISPQTGDKLNVVKASQILRDIFEGHAANGLDMLGSLFTQAGTPHLPDNYVAKLLAMQGSAVAALSPRQELLNHGSRLTLYNITCGMLAYVVFYTGLRSLETAQRCASLARKVGQQLHSNHTLALAHYCDFVAQLHRGRAAEAADSIAIALQLTAMDVPDARLPPALGGSPPRPTPSRSHPSLREAREEVGRDASGAPPLRAVCYASAAELLLLFPGVVPGGLRAALSAGPAPPLSPLLPPLSPSEDGNESEDATGGRDAGSPEKTKESGGNRTNAGGGGRAVVVQTVAQTVRHALWLVESAARLRPSRAWAWTDLVAAFSRETVRLAGSIYGMTTSASCLEAVAIRRLLLLLEEEGEVHWIPMSVRPPYVLLTEMVRLTAHKMLAAQGGRAWHVVQREKGPLHIACQFLLGVQRHYGKDGLRMVEEDFFFSTLLQYVQGCWLARNGFAAAAYDRFESAAYLIYTIAGAPNKSQRNKMASEIVPTPSSTTDEHGALNKSYEKLLALYIRKCSTDRSMKSFFWSPDLLLLLSDIQHRRGELALYMGYSEAIEDMAEVLDAISANCSFVYGTLVSKLLRLMSLQQRLDYSGILQHSAKLLKAVEKVGFTHLADIIRVRQATTLRCAGQWMETLELLQQFGNASHLFEPWQLLTRLTAGCEALLSSTAFLPPTDAITATTTDVVVRFLEEGIHELQARGYLGALEEVLQRHFSSKNEGNNESVGVSLHELLCIHASAARSIEVFLSNRISEPHSVSSYSYSSKTCPSELAELLCKRHQLRNMHECFAQQSDLEICEMLLKGELAKFGS